MGVRAGSSEFFIWSKCPVLQFRPTDYLFHYNVVMDNSIKFWGFTGVLPKHAAGGHIGYVNQGFFLAVHMADKNFLLVLWLAW